MSDSADSEAYAEFRIAVGSIYQEGNSFVNTRTDLDLFRNSYLLEGDELLKLAGTHTEVAGILSVCDVEGVKVFPLLAASSVPGGPLTDDCYTYLRDSLLDRLAASEHIDGVILALHGAMLSVSEPDPEGEILMRVRAIVGPRVPVVATLDLHAHITPRMVENASALVSFAHYPHDDTFSTGERGATLLLDAVRGTTRPTMAVAKPPMVVSAANSQTSGSGPMVRLTARARALEQRSEIISVSCVPVQPHLDVEGMGCTAVVVTDDNRELAKSTALSLAEEFWARRAEFEPEILPVAQAVERGRSDSGGPVLLVDASDCAGGGAPGDSVALLRDLLDFSLTETAYLMVVDAAAVEACVMAGTGGDVTVELGYRSDPSWGRSVRVSGIVGTLGDGRFRYTGGPYGGTVASMGAFAVLQIGTIKVLIMSSPTYDWADEQYRAAGMDVRRAKFVGAKNPMNHRLAYKDVAVATYLVDTPGPTTADVRKLNFQVMRRPFFPFDDEIPNLQISVTQN